MLITVLRSDRMDLHQNAKTTPNGRLLMVQRLVEGWSVARVAAAFGVTTRAVRTWQARHAREGLAGLRDRSSRPHVSPTRLDEAAAATTLALRRKHRNVQALCQRCHLLHDRPEHRRRIRLTLRRRRALGDLFLMLTLRRSLLHDLGRMIKRGRA